MVSRSRAGGPEVRGRRDKVAVNPNTGEERGTVSGLSTFRILFLEIESRFAVRRDPG